MKQSLVFTGILVRDVRKSWENLLRRATFISAGTAPNFDNAMIVKTISGEFVMKTATKLPARTPLWCKISANESTSEMNIVSS
jgi:hypothetical protein